MKIDITYYEDAAGVVYVPIRYDFMGIKLKIINPGINDSYYLTYLQFEHKLQSRELDQVTYNYDPIYYNDPNNEHAVQFVHSKVIYAGNIWVVSAYSGFESQCFELQNISHLQTAPIWIYEFKFLKLYEEKKISIINDTDSYIRPNVKFIWNRILWKITEDGIVDDTVYFEGIRAIDSNVYIRVITGFMYIEEFQEKIDNGEITFPSDQIFKIKEL